MSSHDRIPPNDPLAPKPWLARAAESLAQLRPVTWFLVNIGTKIDPWLMRVSGGRLNTTGTKSVVVLHHVGAKSGQPRETPLVYFTDGEDVVLIASNGGSAKHPAWLHNVRANPDVRLSVGETRHPYLARVATDAERARLWPLANALYRGYDGYQARAEGRTIPMVVCSPSR